MTQSCCDCRKQQQPSRDPGDSVLAANSFSQIANSQKKESSHQTGDGHVTGGRTRVTASSHARPLDSQLIASAIVATAKGPSKNTSIPVVRGSGQKTATGSNETSHGQKGSVTNHGESAFVHATANGPWSEGGHPRPVMSHLPRAGTATLFPRSSTPRRS